jgi:hypothetical protein
MGKRRSQAAFSLFSFQDIITSVTAILILIMLLLTLELISRRRNDAVADPNTTRQHFDTLTATLEDIAQRLREDVNAATRALIDRRSRAELDNELRRSQDQLATATSRLAETKALSKAVAEARHAAETRAAHIESQRDVVAALTAEQERDRKEADRLEQANQQGREEQARRRRAGAELVFNPPQDAGRRSWMVVVQGDAVVAHQLGADRQESLGLDTGAGGMVARWIGSLAPTADQCLLLLRPSADLSLVADIESALEQAGIRYGIDLVGEEQTVRIGSAVAAGAPD